MFFSTKRLQFWNSAVLVGLVSQLAFGAGYEKTLTWSAKHNSLGGVGTAVDYGPENLYFNPANLGDGRGTTASLQFSPTFTSVSGPITTGGEKLDAETGFLPISGALVSWSTSRAWGIGLGVYAAGGSRVAFNEIDYSAQGFTQLKPSAKTSLTVVEYSLGVGGEVLPKFRIGAAWRVVQVAASMTIPKMSFNPNIGGANSNGDNVLTEITIDGMSQVSFSGARVGMSYMDEDWGVGATYRSAIPMSLHGTSSGRMKDVNPANAPTTITGGQAILSNTFPWSLGMGGFKKFSVWTAFLQYDFTNYSVNQQVSLQGTVRPILGGDIDLAANPILQNWRDQHVARFGGEYRGVEGFSFRAGYALTAPVTPPSTARVTFSPPGFGHSLCAGAGTSVFARQLDLDLAAEYSFVSGRVAASDLAGVAAPLPMTGDYAANAIVLHLGARYLF